MAKESPFEAVVGLILLGGLAYGVVTYNHSQPAKPQTSEKPKLTALQQAFFKECKEAYPSRIYGYNQALRVSLKCSDAEGKLPMSTFEYEVASAMQKAAQAHIDAAPGEVARLSDKAVDELLARGPKEE